jgi:hypothetical protein
MNLVKLAHDGFIVESICLILVLNLVLGTRQTFRKGYASLLMAYILESQIMSSDLLIELKELDATEPSSLSEAVRLRSRRMLVMREYNTSKSTPVFFTIFASILVVSCILAWRPLFLISLVMSDLVISRLRVHILYSFR